MNEKLDRVIDWLCNYNKCLVYGHKEIWDKDLSAQFNSEWYKSLVNVPIKEVAGVTYYRFGPDFELGNNVSYFTVPIILIKEPEFKPGILGCVSFTHGYAVESWDEFLLIEKDVLEKNKKFNFFWDLESYKNKEK